MLRSSKGDRNVVKCACSVQHLTTHRKNPKIKNKIRLVKKSSHQLSRVILVVTEVASLVSNSKKEI